MSSPQITWDAPGAKSVNAPPQVQWDEEKRPGTAGKFTQLPGMPSLADAPGNPRSMPPMQTVRTLTGTPYNPGRFERAAVDQVGSAVQSAANISAPVIGHRVLQRLGAVGPGSRLYPEEGTLKDAARDATLLMAGGAEGLEAEPAAISARVARPTAVSPAVEAGTPGILGRAREVAVRRAGRIPGVQATKDALYIVGGKGEAAAAPPLIAKPSAAPIPETNGVPWGTGGPGPIELRGKSIPKPEGEVIGERLGNSTPTSPLDRLRNQELPPEQSDFIPERPSVERIAPPSAVKPSAKISPKAVEQQLGEALGAEPAPKIVPGVKIKNQPTAQAAATVGRPAATAKTAPLGNLGQEIQASLPPSQAPVMAPLENLGAQIKASTVELPKDFTPTESSLLAGYKYDPVKQQLSAITNTGQHYVHAEVTPEEAHVFENAKSKGNAWNKLRSSHVQVEKNGEPTNPIAPHSAGPGDVAPGEDLTPLLKKSIAAARARKSTR